MVENLKNNIVYNLRVLWWLIATTKRWISLNGIQKFDIFKGKAGYFARYELKFLKLCYMKFVLRNVNQTSAWEVGIYFTTTQYGIDEI